MVISMCQYQISIEDPRRGMSDDMQDGAVVSLRTGTLAVVVLRFIPAGSVCRGA